VAESEDFLGFDQSGFANPFENSGLSKEAIKALLELDNGEALQTAASGIRRVLARALHPDVAGAGVDTSFVEAVVEATQEIERLEPEDALTFARAFAIGKKRSSKGKPKEVVAQSVEEYAKDIILSLAEGDLERIGITFQPNRRLLVRGHYRSADESSIHYFHQTSPEECTATHFSEETPGDDRQAAEQAGQDILPAIPWGMMYTKREMKKLLDPDSSLKKDRRTSRQVTLEGTICIEGASNRVFSADGRQVAQDLPEISNSSYFADDGIYSFAGRTKNPDHAGTTVDSVTVYSRRFIPTGSHEAMDRFRIIGALNSEFMRQYGQLLDNHVVENTDPRNRQEELRLVLKQRISDKSAKFKADQVKGVSIPEKAVALLSRNFTPDIDEGQILLAVVDGELRAIGYVLRAHYYEPDTAA